MTSWRLLQQTTDSNANAATKESQRRLSKHYEDALQRRAQNLSEHLHLADKRCKSLVSMLSLDAPIYISCMQWPSQAHHFKMSHACASVLVLGTIICLPRQSIRLGIELTSKWFTWNWYSEHKRRSFRLNKSLHGEQTAHTLGFGLREAFLKTWRLRISSDAFLRKPCNILTP